MADDSTPRALPKLDDENRFFWTAGAEGRLKFLHCDDCDAFVHPPQPVCRGCLSENLAPKAVSGLAVVDTFTLNHQLWHPGVPAPVVVARVAFDDAPGVFLTTNIVGCPPEEVDIGDRVRVTFEQRGEIHIPLFEKVA
jgi:uncharacterized OB-fold protein